MELLELTDADDSRLDDYRGLTDTALRRVAEPEGGLYIAESAKVIERAVAAGHRPRSVMVQRRWVDGIRSTMQALDVPVYVVPDTVAEAVAGFAVHRGALASMHRPELPSVASVAADARLVLILADIGDHANIGAAFRAAAGLGADAVLVSPGCADPLYRRSVRVSMGTVFQVPWTRMPDWSSTVDALRDAQIATAALALDERAVPLREFVRERPERVALMMGSEGDGLSAEALMLADHVVTIPMSGGVDSLNVASAAAVALWALADH
ncbi:TrmH family RNA methyltransferase [Microbacterium hydrocarbonoxydans]|uniref:TrmH family RNA methyltransferase n=1 Tax=Microbacterium hydrocarbonoxydans TaxID=273678 RepID=UPI00203DF940|nr:RNA methyltransferase [Microbacterium hydrocarbonoxydans]MCM3778905.1 RNA methyltransferase [Microbacterium hydrocarbonoxydans]